MKKTHTIQERWEPSVQSDGAVCCRLWSPRIMPTIQHGMQMAATVACYPSYLHHTTKGRAERGVHQGQPQIITGSWTCRLHQQLHTQKEYTHLLQQSSVQCSLPVVLLGG
ncbi:hypothetical protein VTN02DRAFT_593 [Thermoascus thermophilus]